MKTCFCGHEEWEYMDDIRSHAYWWDRGKTPVGTKLGFKACRHCGFITYDRHGTEAEMEAYYTADYRKAVDAGHIITGNRKAQFHGLFLGDILKDFKGHLLDVGCATGSMLKALRDGHGIPNEQLHGTELTAGFRAFGKTEFGLDIRGHLADWPGQKFRLISYYHVLEHLYDPLRELRDTREALEDDGLLYIAVPVFCGLLDEASGSPTTDFENLFHKDHINVFTAISVENILWAAGFEIVRRNDSIYGFTLLAKKGKVQGPRREDWRKLKEIIARQREAIHLLVSKRPKEALKVYPHYPEAQITMAFFKENMRDENAQKKILDEALKLMPNSARLWKQRGLVEMQWAGSYPPTEQKKRCESIARAEEYLDKSHSLKPGAEDYYHHKAYIAYAFHGDAEAACTLWRKGVEINPAKFAEFMAYIGAARAGVALQSNQQPAPPTDEYSRGMVQMVVPPRNRRLAEGMGGAVSGG